MSLLKIAKSVIEDEINGIREVAKKLDSNFENIVETIKSSNGRVVMCGMGKSGHIAKKIFATLVSTGTPSLFIHPAEAFHGDLGMILPEDIFFALSNSGETAEVLQLLPFIKDNGNTLISMTGNQKSSLSLASDLHIDIGVSKEACPFNLAPTTSTTASLVVGDALAIALMTSQNFQEEHFARYHPGGSLGKKLLSLVKEALAPAIFVNSDDRFADVISALSKSSSGTVLVGKKDKIEGIITDGDVRKNIETIPKINISYIEASSLMTNSPKTVSSITKCSDADIKMAKEGVNSLVVIENGSVLGIYNNLNRK